MTWQLTIRTDRAFTVDESVARTPEFPSGIISASGGGSGIFASSGGSGVFASGGE